MVDLLPGSEPGRVKRTLQVPAHGVVLVQEKGVSGVPRLLTLALMQAQVLVVFVL